MTLPRCRPRPAHRCGPIPACGGAIRVIHTDHTAGHPARCIVERSSLFIGRAGGVAGGLEL